MSDEEVHKIQNWIAAHDARIDELWRVQLDTNENNAKSLESINGKLTALEKKIIWVVALTAGAGGAIGQLIMKAF